VWQLGIAYDKFIRTTDEHHEAIVAEFYKRVEAKGDIYQAKYEGLYCVNCEEYKVLAINQSHLLFIVVLYFLMSLFFSLNFDVLYIC